MQCSDVNSNYSLKAPWHKYLLTSSMEVKLFCCYSSVISFSEQPVYPSNNDILPTVVVIVLKYKICGENDVQRSW